jgi:hypothetical protein
MIGICLPSRGLIHSRTMEAVLEAVGYYGVEFYFSHDKPMPECFNDTVKRALDDDADFVLIIEEDIVIPKEGIMRLLGALETADVAYFDYWLENGKRCLMKVGDYDICGTGAIMFTRKAIETLYPFDNLQQYDGRTLEPLNRVTVDRAEQSYGGHDVDLFKRAQDMGMTLTCVGECKHLRVTELGNKKKNKGYHTVKELDGTVSPETNYI